MLITSLLIACSCGRLGLLFLQILKGMRINNYQDAARGYAQVVMVHPALCTGDGQSYERAAIVEWLKSHNTSPVTGQLLESKDLLPNHVLRSMIQVARSHR